MTNAKKRGLVAAVISAAVLLVVILHITFNVNPIIAQVSEKEVQDLATIAVNSACDEVLSASNPVEFVDYLLDDGGNLQMIKTNTSLMNTISRKAIELSQQKIATLGEQGVPIPLGSLSGIMALSGQGPDIYIKVFPIGAVNATFTSEFVAAGINQTRHKIILNVFADIRVVMPGANNTVSTATQILICENVIVGKVPDAYFNSQNLSDLFNLVP